MDRETIISRLTSGDYTSMRDFADIILGDSQFSDKWYEYLDTFVSLLDHPESRVRSYTFYIIAANTKWDKEDRFDSIFPAFVGHITDKDSLSARQCINALAEICIYKPKYIPHIIDAFRKADLSKYTSNEIALIRNDMYTTECALFKNKSSDTAIKGE